MPDPNETHGSDFVGKAVPRDSARRLSKGRGRYVDDIAVRNPAHVAFVRSPYAHARIEHINTHPARAVPGVIDVVTGEDMKTMCRPWVGVLTHFPGLKSAEQFPLACGVARWQGEPVVAVLARSRALAEDGADLVEIDWQELQPVVEAETALADTTPVIHPELGDNLAFGLKIDKGDVDQAFATAAHIAEGVFHFGRHTGLTLEPRSIVADFDPALGQLTVYHAFKTILSCKPL